MTIRKMLITVTSKMAAGVNFHAYCPDSRLVDIIVKYSSDVSVDTIPENNGLLFYLKQVVSLANEGNMHMKGFTPDVLTIKEICSFVYEHFDNLRDNTYTYRLLNACVRLQPEWNLDANDISTLQQIYEAVHS